MCIFSPNADSTISNHIASDSPSRRIKLRILQGRVAPEVKSRLYENTEVRYNNALFHIKRSTQLMKD